MNDDERDQRSAERVWTEESVLLQEALRGLSRMGRMWAHHGLRVAEMALKTSAETLRVTADTLAQGASHLDEEPDVERLVP